MISTLFQDTVGEETKNPDPGWLKKLVFNAGDDFWDIDSGQGAIDFYQDGKEVSALILKGLDQYGFMVDYRTPGGDTPLLLTLTHGPHTGETVEASTGGNPMLYFREYFVPKEMAWEAIEHFLKTGRPKENLRWEIAQTVEQDF